MTHKQRSEQLVRNPKSENHNSGKAMNSQKGIQNSIAIHNKKQEQYSQVSRDFKGIWIPKEIWLHPNLNAIQKILWAEIHSLYSEEHDGCYASEQYLSSFLGVHRANFYRALKVLIDLGLVEKVKFTGRRTILKAISPQKQEKPRCRKNATPDVAKTRHEIHKEEIKEEKKDRSIDRIISEKPDSVNDNLDKDPDCPKSKALQESYASSRIVIQPKTFRRWIKKYGRAFLIDTVKDIRRQFKRNPSLGHGNIEAYIEQSLKC